MIRLSTLLFLGFFLFLAACDWHGPWEYYPEENEIYRGIYTYGYIVEGEAPTVCFQKVYELDEASAEDFPFYDSAFVTVSGNFLTGKDSSVLYPKMTDGNCFEGDVKFRGVAGESYTLNAFFKWDSAGTSVKSAFRAVASIPTKFGFKGVQIPQMDGSYKWQDFKTEGERAGKFSFEFLEFPMDMSIIKFATDYDNSVEGVLLTMEYNEDSGNSGENMHTTINNMLGGMVEKDSLGYTGIAMHDPLERIVDEGYETRQVVGGISMMDSLMMTNMSFPIGPVKLHFYATDKAYSDYRNKVLASFEDPRVVPASNIQGGMGVFSGMKHVYIDIEVLSDDYVSFDHIAASNCINGDMNTESWGSKACRLWQDSYCMDSVPRPSETCYASLVKQAMMMDSSRWSVFLPDTIGELDKFHAYGDGLKRYCVASDFNRNHDAVQPEFLDRKTDCSEMYEQCMVSLEKSNCKEYLWQWCSDRNWGVEYPQCGSALVSRYYLENQKSTIIKDAVNRWCTGHPEDPQCKR